MFTPRKLIVFGLISVVFLVFVSWIFTTVSGSFHDITRKAQTEHIATLAESLPSAPDDFPGWKDRVEAQSPGLKILYLVGDPTDAPRLASEDPEVSPRALAGGEDWLLVYKAFWKERIDARVDEFREERRYRALAEEIASFVGDAGLRTFAFISREERPGVPPVRLELALSFLDGFYRGPFVSSLNRPLKIVLVDGEFYRKENRLEFTDAYDEILRLAESISALDARLGPDGDLGSSWTQAQFEVAPIAIKHRKLQTVQRNVDEEAERIVKSAGAALLELVRVIRGILKGEAGGRYDSLANLSYLDGRANKEFQKALSAAKDRCEKAHNLLAQLSGLDLGQTE